MVEGLWGYEILHMRECFVCYVSAWDDVEFCLNVLSKYFVEHGYFSKGELKTNVIQHGERSVA